jgi:hypothetical protein
MPPTEKYTARGRATHRPTADSDSDSDDFFINDAHDDLDEEDGEDADPYAIVAMGDTVDQEMEEEQDEDEDEDDDEDGDEEEDEEEDGEEDEEDDEEEDEQVEGDGDEDDEDEEGEDDEEEEGEDETLAQLRDRLVKPPEEGEEGGEGEEEEEGPKAYRKRQMIIMRKLFLASKDLTKSQVLMGNRGIHNIDKHFTYTRSHIRKMVMRGQPNCPENLDDQAEYLVAAGMLVDALAPKLDKVRYEMNMRGLPRGYKCPGTLVDIFSVFLVCNVDVVVKKNVVDMFSDTAPLQDALAAVKWDAQERCDYILKQTQLISSDLQNKRFLRLLFLGSCAALCKASWSENWIPTPWFKNHDELLFAKIAKTSSGGGPAIVPTENKPGHFGAAVDSKGAPDKSTVRVRFVEVRAGYSDNPINGVKKVLSVAPHDSYVAHIPKTHNILHALKNAVEQFPEIGMKIGDRRYELMLPLKTFDRPRFDYIDCAAAFRLAETTLGERCDNKNKLTLYVRYFSADPEREATERAAQAPWFYPETLSEIKVFANGATFPLPMPAVKDDLVAMRQFLVDNLDSDNPPSVRMFNKKKAYTAVKALPHKKEAAFRSKAWTLTVSIWERTKKKHDWIMKNKKLMDQIVTGFRAGVLVS